MKFYKAKCSQCGRGFRRSTRSDLLSALRKHLWSKHRAWMISRIKQGVAQRSKVNPTAQSILGKIMQAVFPMIPPPSKHADRAIAVVDVAINASRQRLNPAVLTTWTAFKAMYRFRKFGKTIEEG